MPELTQSEASQDGGARKIGHGNMRRDQETDQNAPRENEGYSRQNRAMAEFKAIRMTDFPKDHLIR